MPPMSWTSKWRMLSTRRPPSRTTAKASGSRSSRVAPFARRSRNSTVFPARSWSDSARRAGSNVPIWPTTGRMRFSSRSFRVPTMRVRMELIMLGDGPLAGAMETP